MLDTALITPIASLGAVGVICVLLILGIIVPKGVVDDLKARLTVKDEVIAEKDRALASERARADAAVAAAQASHDLIAAMQAGVQLAQHPAGEGPPPGGGR